MVWSCGVEASNGWGGAGGAVSGSGHWAGGGAATPPGWLRRWPRCHSSLVNCGRAAWGALGSRSVGGAVPVRPLEVWGRRCAAAPRCGAVGAGSRRGPLGVKWAAWGKGSRGRGGTQGAAGGAAAGGRVRWGGTAPAWPRVAPPSVVGMLRPMAGATTRS